MVCGNGDISANVWIDTAGHLHCYVGKTDSRDEAGRLLKITELEMSFTPALFKDPRNYRESFDLQTASFSASTSQGHLRCWVDANDPQLVVQVDARHAVKATVTTHVWRRPRGYENETPDTLLTDRNDRVILFHRNTGATVFDKSMKVFKLNKDSVYNPMNDLTWGILVAGNHFKHITDSSITTPSPQSRLELRVTVYTSQTPTSQEWVRQIEALSLRSGARPANQLFQRHASWWKIFWNRSYIDISSSRSTDADTVYLVNRAYYYNRYVMNIAARGKYPIQFNGSTWLVDTYPDTIHSIVAGDIRGKNADYRLWGDLILWQNMRIPYWTMLATGDTSSMHSLLDFYTGIVYPRMKDFTQKVLGFQGCLFTESTKTWGTPDADIYGWNRDGEAPEHFINEAHQNHYVCGLEVVNLLLDYFEYTGDTSYLRQRIWPVARDLVTYYGTRYPLDSNGKVSFYPDRSLESFSDCTNATPTVAGLQFILPRLGKLAVVLKDPSFFSVCRELIKRLPAVPIRREEGGDVILAAEKVGRHINVEQPDLYAVYPFRLYDIGTEKLETGKYTFEHPSFSEVLPGSYRPMPMINLKNGNASRAIFSWNQTGIQAAYLGFADYAKEILVRSALSNDKRFRFPAFYGPNYDWTPDGDHLAVINMTLQSMVLQSEGEHMFLLPAWPKKWNVRFKLNGTDRTVVKGTYVNGRLQTVIVTPVGREKDVQVMR